MGISGHLCILLGNALSRVYHNNAHVGSLYGILGTHYGKFFHSVVYPAFLTYAGGVNKYISALIVFKPRVDGVPGRSGNVAYYNALFAKYSVYH